MAPWNTAESWRLSTGSAIAHLEHSQVLGLLTGVAAGALGAAQRPHHLRALLGRASRLRRGRRQPSALRVDRALLTPLRDQRIRPSGVSTRSSATGAYQACIRDEHLRHRAVRMCVIRLR